MTKRSLGLETNRVADTDTYDNEPHLLSLGEGELLLVYREASIQTFDGEETGHLSDDGRIVVRRSFDQGKSWTEPTIVADHASYDTRNQSVVHDPRTGQITVFYRLLDAVEYVTGESPGQHGLYSVMSTDGGRSWSDPVDHSEWGDDSEQYVPFGGGVETAAGLLTTFYSGSGLVECCVSADGGKTWNDPRRVVEPQTDGTLGEPVPCALSDEQVLIVGRENESASFFAVRSADGGKTWEEPQIFDPTGMDMGTPLWLRKTAPNEVTAVWGDRTNKYLYTTHASAHLAWQDPTRICDPPRKRLHAMLADPDTLGDFGYPTIARINGARHDQLVAFYDGSPDPDVWVLPSY